MSTVSDGFLKPLAAAAGFMVVLILLGAASDSQPAGVQGPSLEERLQRVEDERQIRNLMALYGEHLDSLDFERYSQLFAAEGEWSGLLGEPVTIKGPEAIRSAMEEAFAERTYDPAHVTNLHLISNVRIDIDGDRASGYSRWTVLSRNDDGQPAVRLSGRYDDLYVREDGKWKFLRRTARREIP